MSFSLTATQLKEWWLGSPDICAYCASTISEFIHLRDHVINYTGLDGEILKFKRVFHCPSHAVISDLTIDRIDNTKGYLIDNMTKACWFCNHIKGSLLTHNDMTLISPHIIGRLKNRIAGLDENTTQEVCH